MSNDQPVKVSKIEVIENTLKSTPETRVDVPSSEQIQTQKPEPQQSEESSIASTTTPSQEQQQHKQQLIEQGEQKQQQQQPSTPVTSAKKKESTEESTNQQITESTIVTPDYIQQSMSWIRI